jgi:hypothetical protein
MSALVHAKSYRELVVYQNWIETAADCGYLSRSQATDLLAKCSEIGRLLGGMMAKAELFCKPESLSIREQQTFYQTENWSLTTEN